MFKTYKYRLFTNANQERELSIMLETHRRLYNQLLDGRILCWETAGENWSWAEQSRWFTKQRAINKYYARLNVSSAKETIFRLDKAFASFFKGCGSGERFGYPKFKSADRFNSFSYELSGHGGGCKVVNGKLRLQNIGTIRVRWHRKIGGNIKQATILRSNGRWFVCFAVEVDDPSPITVAQSVGVDVGLKSFVTTSDGDSLGDSRILEDRRSDLRVRQRKLSRAKRGSNTRKKTKKQLTNLHAKIKNTRRDMHHKVARTLVNRYGFIAAESLNILAMVKNRRLARRIMDAGWGGFLEIVKQKCEEMGGHLVLVDPRNTSQMCSACGSIVKKGLTVRIHKCKCGLVLDRDVNAARNILARALPEFAKLGDSLV